VAKTKAKTKNKVAAKQAPKKKKAFKKHASKKTAKPVKKTAVKTAAKSAAKAVAKQPRAKSPNGVSELLRDAALKILDERKAEEIVTVNLMGKSSVADYLIVASGHASRQITAIAHYLQEAFTKLGAGRIRTEGMSQGNWVLIDAGDVIIHLFRPEVRRYYNIERLWENEETDIERTPLLLE
jgi:ribosome-associated protein